MAKKPVEGAGAEQAPSPVQAKEAPDYSPAQLYKLEQLKKVEAKKAKKRSEVLESLKEKEAAYSREIRGRWIPYVEKNGVESPAFVLAERFEEKGEDLSVILTLLVYSPFTAQPYRAEITL